MRKYRKLSLFLMVFLAASLFTGCNKDEKELVNAFLKSQEILSLESASDMTFNLKAEGLDEASQVVFDQIAKQINEMKLSISQKSVTNEEQTVAKAQIDAKVQLQDMNFDSSIWVDMDMSGDKMVLKEYFRLPSMLMDFIPGAAGKEYILLDFDTMNESMATIGQDMPEPMDMGEIMAIAMKYQDKFMDAFMAYIKNYHADLPVVTKLDNKTLAGEIIKYYQVKFDDDSFKDFLKYTTISILEDESIIPLFKEYMMEIMALSGEEMPKELAITENTSDMVKSTEEFFQKMKVVPILGEEGILITLGINEDGYFAHEAGKMDFLIDTKGFMDAFADPTKESEMLEEMPTPVFELAISYDTKMSRINEDLEITMPSMTKENSIDYMELIENMILEDRQDVPEQELMVIIEDEIIEFTNKPILVNNHYMVSSRDIAKPLGIDLAWNQETKEVIMVKDENQLNVNGHFMIRDGVSYIPLRMVADKLSYTFEWQEEFKMILINK